jgi:S-adenosyl methyltransferase
MEDVMERRQDASGETESPGLTFDASVAHPARIYNYWLGGKDNFAADRQAAQEVLDVMPVIAQVARSNRMFLSTAVHYLVAQAGIRQFLDIGTGLPTENNTHEVAQGAGARTSTPTRATWTRSCTSSRTPTTLTGSSGATWMPSRPAATWPSRTLPVISRRTRGRRAAVASRNSKSQVGVPVPAERDGEISDPLSWNSWPSRLLTLPLSRVAWDGCRRRQARNHHPGSSTATAILLYSSDGLQLAGRDQRGPIFKLGYLPGCDLHNHLGGSAYPAEIPDEHLDPMLTWRFGNKVRLIPLNPLLLAVYLGD